MKQILLISVLLSSVLFAEGVVNPSQIKTMQTLEAAMATIQKGFLYNNETVVGGGVKDLEVALKDVDAFVIAADKPITEDKDFNPKAYALTETAAIGKEAKELLELYKDGKKDEAREAYSIVLNRCVVCHKIIRKW